MSTEDRLYRMMSMVGQGEVEDGAWAGFVAVAHRDRLRHRIVAASALVATVAIASLGTAAVLNMDRADLPIPPSAGNVAVPLPEDVPSDCPTAPEFTEGPLGTVAYLGATELHVVDVATGEDSILVQGGEGFGEGFFAGDVQISPDGQWLSFGEGLLVPTAGGEVCAPLGEGVHGLEWAPDGRMAALKDGEVDGELVVGGVHELPSGHSYGGYPFRSLALSPDGRWAAVAAIPPNVRVSDRSDESSEWRENFPGLWVIDLQSSSYEVLKFSPLLGDLTGIEIAEWSPDGKWILFWNTYQDGASINADGSPLRALEVATGDVRTITDYMITDRDQMAWCGDRLLFADGLGRLLQDQRSIAQARPPLWEKEIVLEADDGSNYVDPACDGAGNTAAAIAIPVGGSASDGSLLSWEVGSDVISTAPLEAEHGFRFPQYSDNGDVTVLEHYWGKGDPGLIVLDDGMRKLGDLLGQAASPMLGGSPGWDWHRP